MRKIKLLFVDDSKTTTQIYSHLFKSKDYTVEVANTVNQVMEILETKPLPHFILIDYFMPEMNGPVLIEKIKEKFNEFTPKQFVIITGLSQTGKFFELKTQGVRIIEKPYDLKKLLNFVEELVESVPILKNGQNELLSLTTNK